MGKRALLLILFLIAFLSANVIAAVCTAVDSDIMITVDNTNSIRSPVDHSSQVTNAVKDFINKVSLSTVLSNNRIGIVSFGNVYPYSKLLSNLSYIPSKKNQLIDSLSNLDFVGDSTIIHDGLNRTLKEFKDNPRNVDKYIILFTDGLPTGEGCYLGELDWVEQIEYNCDCDNWHPRTCTTTTCSSRIPGCVDWLDGTYNDCCNGYAEVTYDCGYCEGGASGCQIESAHWEPVWSDPQTCIKNISNTIKNLGIKIYVIDTSGTHDGLLKSIASDPSKYYDLNDYNKLSETFTNISQEVSCKPPIITVTSPQAITYTPYNSNIINFIANSTATTSTWIININGQNTTIPSSYYSSYGVNYPRSFNDENYTIKFYAQESESTKKIWSVSDPITFTIKKAFCNDGIIQFPEKCDNTNLNGQTCQGLGFTNGNLACNSTCGFNTLACFNMPIIKIISPANNAAFVENQDIAIKATSNIPIKKWNYTFLITTPSGGKITINGEDSGALSQLFDNNIVKVSPIGQCKLTVWGTTPDGIVDKDEINCTISAPAFVPLWTDMSDNVITNATIGSTVKMTYKNSGLAPGATATFQVYEDDPIWDDNIRTTNDANAITGVVDSLGNLVANMTIVNTDWANGQKGGAEDTEQFYFTVEGFPSSSNLKIISQGNIDFTIDLDPSCGNYFNVSQPFQITVNAIDDELITGKLTISDSNNNVISTSAFSNGVSSMMQTLSISGTYKIVAEGSNADGERVRKISNIMIIDTSINGKYVAACISEPVDYSNLPNGIVKFNASSTTGIDYKTPGIFTKIPLKDINLHWTFSDQRTSPYIDGADTTSYNFYKIFLAVNDNSADLEAKLK